jgi:hypothetical protein
VIVTATVFNHIQSKSKQVTEKYNVPQVAMKSLPIPRKKNTSEARRLLQYATL